MKEVAFIEQDLRVPLNTDTGPLLIGANDVWDGTAGSAEFKGEGIIIGILDTGINTDHRSFSATGDDGYTVVNPWGDDTYVGDCVADATLCNSKLIGVRSYPEITDNYTDAIFAVEDQRPANGQDYNGHGSHTASTAGGNALENVPYVINDLLAGNTDDGISTSYTFPSMSGVAPHANIIAYQICDPGNTGDTHAGCAFSATLAAIEEAIVDDVDVINYSIGGTTPFSPWNSSIELGFLGAQAAGIFVATSAGNSGPGAGSTTKVSPWYTSVAAANHGNDRISSVGNKSVGAFSGGDTAAPADISGSGINGAFTGDIVYAGDFANPNDPDGDSAQCLEPFPGGTFTATQIVVCDRGDIARVAKAANAASGGAGGFVLANIQGGADTLGDDYYEVPGVHISADDGDILKTWLSTGTAHQATITAETLQRDTNTADQIASFSSRGPNQFGEMITPQIAAPGVSIYAAYSDDQPFNDETGGAPQDFAFLQGTSMASPHVAGAAALMTQAHPSWNPDQIRSALMMTSTDSMLKEDGLTAADSYDMGAGRVQVDMAINAGLVMSESQLNYESANPADGGDPKTLNVPSMANFSCAASCSWTRTFTAVRDGTYTVTSSATTLTMEPSSLELLVGESSSVTFTLDVTGDNTGSNVYESVLINASGQPELHLPVHALVNNGAVPDEINMVAGRDDGSWAVSGVQSLPTDNLNFSIDGLYDANAVGFNETVEFSILEDPSSDHNPIDNFEEVFTFPFVVPANSVSLTAAIADSTSQDNDLYILMDTNGDGTYNSVVAQVASFATNEVATIDAPVEGAYLVVVQNYLASAPGALDTGNLTVSITPQTDPVAGLSVDAPLAADGLVDIKLVWNIAMVPGDSYYADVTVNAGTTELGTFRATLDRVVDDVSSSAIQTSVARGEQIDYTISLTPTVYNQDVEYSASIDMPSNMSLVEGSVVVTGGNLTVKNPNAEPVNFEDSFDMGPDSDNSSYTDDITDGVHVFEFDVPSAIVSMNIAISEATSPDNDLFIEYAADGVNFVNQLGFNGATGATNEILTVASPAEGRWRAVVQNYASPNASDTGELSILLTPATGEGFFWNISAPGLKPLYTVDSSATSTSCANAGFGGYLSLEGLGFGTLGVSGDTAAWTLWGDRIFPFYGSDRTEGMTFTDDGFVIFSGTPGGAPWANTSLPNLAEPNDMIALLWKDMEIVDDVTRGIRAAAGGEFTYLDYDEVQGWGQDSERLSFGLFAFNSLQEDDYEFVVSYASSQIGDLDDGTAGVENADGTIGTDASSMIEPGVQLCYNYNAPPLAYEVTFSVVPTADYLGQDAAPMVSIESDMVGTEDMLFRASPVELVNVGPTANAGDDITYDRADAPSQIRLSASATLDIDEDVMSYVWTQTAGVPVTIHASGAIDAFFNLSDASNGSYTFSVEVSDGEFTSSDEVTITITGKEANEGVGSLNLLILLLGIPLFFRRRYIK
ncbi:MAG: S8 family serine peptidase [Kangiellaceae bacterium]|nr:S8 family serine peptidase [Kangiellaceae bacterium]